MVHKLINLMMKSVIEINNQLLGFRLFGFCFRRNQTIFSIQN